MKYSIPAKTFVVGEYAALSGEGAIILTTSPDFSVSITEQNKLQNIHPAAPAAKFWRAQNINNHGLLFADPYHGIGGLGASSAQFIGAYLASCQLKKTNPDLEELLDAYWRYSWDGNGKRPSGYDIIAQQTAKKLLYIKNRNKEIKPLSWPLHDLSFLLIHTRKKLATHEHLQQNITPRIDNLAKVVQKAKKAFIGANRQLIVSAINDYQQELADNALIAPHTQEILNHLKQQHQEILAAKGCGAMGADVILIVVATCNLQKMEQKLQEFSIITTSRSQSF